MVKGDNIQSTCYVLPQAILRTTKNSKYKQVIVNSKLFLSVFSRASLFVLLCSVLHMDGYIVGTDQVQIIDATLEI